MPDQHARLAPSAAERWLTCTASVRVAAQYPNESSVYAEEGTAFHTLAERYAAYRLGYLPEREWRTWWDGWVTATQADQERGWDFHPDVMLEHAEQWVALIFERSNRAPQEVAAGATPDLVLLERRVQTGVPMCWGTADAIIVRPSSVEIIDAKYGQGVRVEPHMNPQLMLYGVGALEEYGDVLGVTSDVTITVFQPRLEHTASFFIEAGELRAWRDSILPLAEEALGPYGHFAPSVAGCRFCPAAGDCRARMEWAVAEDFKREPDLLTPEELGRVLSDIPEIQRWCSAVQERGMHILYREGGQVPGWKVVRAAGRRSVTDAAHAIQHAIDQGWNAEQVATFRLRGIGELETLMGKDGFADTFRDFIVKSEGAPSLVPESDKRPSIDPYAEAAKDFS